MTEQFQEQGGAATMDPGVLRRWITSKVMSRMSSEKVQLAKRQRAEKRRQKNGLPHVVEYFHQLDDGYSHLAVQLIAKFAQRYQVELRCHLVTESAGDNLPEPALLSKLSRYDADVIAPYYQLQSPVFEQARSTKLTRQAAQVLANANNDEFIAYAASVSSAMWRGKQDQLAEYAQHLGQADINKTRAVVAAGNARRSELKHYSGAMFYYGGEWYWGVDRLYHLEQRLIELGLDTQPEQELLAPRKQVVHGPLHDDGQLTLEIYPSLRSPYTAVAFDQTVQLAEKTGVKLVVRPVLPMVMRGVPATNEKGQYILFDAGREARAAGVPFGPCADPIGEPTRRAYSLYAWAEQQGKAIEFFSAFLRCAWVDAVNTNTNRGLQLVIEQAGLDWSVAQNIVGNHAWQDMVEQNRLAMYQAGLWGVPSYRLLDEQGDALLSLWGQDRLWTVAAVIQAQLSKRAKENS